MPYLSQMDPDLMGFSRKRLAEEKGCSGPFPHDFPASDRARTSMARSPNDLPLNRLFSRQKTLSETLFLPRNAIDEGEVLFLDSPSRKKLHEFIAHLRIFGEEKRPRRLFIEPMDELAVGAKKAAATLPFADPPSALIDDLQIAIFIENLLPETSGGNPLFPGGSHLDEIASPKRGGGKSLHLSIDAAKPRLQNLPDCFSRLRKLSLQKMDERRRRGDSKIH